MKTFLHGGNIFAYERQGKQVVDFSANINPLGVSENIKRAMEKSLNICHHYPDTEYGALREALGEKEGIDGNYFVVGNGAADLIYRLVLGVKPKKALLLAPTFSEYEEALTLTDCQVEHYFLKEETDFLLTEDFLHQISGYDILFLCNPNNPTGQLIQPELLKKVLLKTKECACVLLLDECFLPLTGKEEMYTGKFYVEDNPQLVILKALTKDYALPGIRIGYGICSNGKLREGIKKSGQPWPVSVIGQAAGIQASKEEQFLRDSVEYIERQKKYLYKELVHLGYKVIYPSANYLFFSLPCKGEGYREEFIKDMIEHGFLIRDCSNYIGLEENKYYRIAVKSEEENRQLMNQLKEREVRWQRR